MTSFFIWLKISILIILPNPFGNIYFYICKIYYMDSKKLLTHYLTNPGRFSVLILGERGIGKTRLVQEVCGDDLVTANCASFSDDTMAESELFGHRKGSFTGAYADKSGMFQDANHKTLFLDEVHALSPRVQQKLMTALQTESSGKNQGKFRIRRVGDEKASFVEARPVFASNLPIEDLRKALLPDLFDRISQLVMKIPSIKESEANLFEEFTKVWEEMKFKEFNECPDSSEFKKWLLRIPLDGNYRSLQNVAINWHQGRIMYKGNNETSVFEFVRSQFIEFHSASRKTAGNTLYNFRKGPTKRELRKEWEQALYDWAVSKEGYGSPGNAEKGLLISRIKRPE